MAGRKRADDDDLFEAIRTVVEEYEDHREQQKKNGDQALGRAPLTGDDGREPVTEDDVNTILNEVSDGLRNHLITLGYWDLSVALLGYTHPGGRVLLDGSRCRGAMDLAGVADLHRYGEGLIKRQKELLSSIEADHQHLPLNANFCTYATWSSLTIGRNVRDRLAPRRVEDLTPDALRVAATRLAIEARRTNSHQLAKLLAVGQKIVFSEITPAIYQLFGKTAELNREITKSAFRANFENERMQNRSAAEAALLACSELEPQLVAYLGRTFDINIEGEARLSPPRGNPLRNGLVSYYLARRVSQLEADPLIDDEDRMGLSKAQAELILRANLQIGSFEQTRVQQVLNFPLADFPVQLIGRRIGLDELASAQAGRWRRRINRTLLDLADERLIGVWRRFFTGQILVLRLGNEVVRLGRDIPDSPTAGCFLPEELSQISDDWLRHLLLRFDQSFGDGHGTAAHDWDDFDSRMNYIANLLRSRAQEPGLWMAPFSRREERRVRVQTDPTPMEGAHGGSH